ncbi:hypothetical protein N7448_010775 [Penicillium atrosanguineum]|uniref:Uncharacterized protein n=1 Tax=Penicillium atrosanguineum TaxID=1132637 RepID=A0A9W9GGX8_9EURO|nr:tRNA-dihydrouridine(20) synthase [Penicillium atrosanguineum]KAJ5119067.1 hypothetical protein N7526_010704 [Penicillium atrosanguineum]KAJ5120106.1 hypothetical protein N7448_010775 [Penicillium atrosanguineum]KAJ5297104.1 tRNA-dihydrouridine(20) synthase [Penicillium atrosanguineum]KAJ5299863.1 hypothetical protein N7476_011420 [Penicillium atrosanguineum]
MLRCRSFLRLQQRAFSTRQALNSIGDWSEIPIPGFNAPLNFRPQTNVVYEYMEGFPNALDPNHVEDGSLDRLVTHREIVMMQLMNIITDKPEWDRKVFNEHITTKWREEVAESGEDATPKMMDWIIKELQWKAGILEKSGFVEVFDDGVLKSDSVISSDLKASLKEAVAPLGNVPEDAKDYHPHSDNKVVDLVHPSLFPVIYNRTHVLRDRIIGLDDCLDSIGDGELLPSPSREESIIWPDEHSPFSLQTHGHSHPPELSTKFQWLPCDVKIAKDGGCRVLSYINNAHPVDHRALYDVVEKILAQVFPLWEKSLSGRGWYDKRIEFKESEYEEGSDPEPVWNPEDIDDNGDKCYEQQWNLWYDSLKIKLPEPGEFRIRDSQDEKVVNFNKHFPNKRFQVVVKLANIELSPERPHYEGGTWHIEGQLNERIAASAIYYYDSENITPSSLAFRHRALDDFEDLMYEQGHHIFLQQVYKFPEDIDGYNDGSITQTLGSVASKEGRLITFPNTLQHQVSSFSLDDHSKPGHRKILALFLVDPHTRIISSANVPPQRADWRRNKKAPQNISAELRSVSEEAVNPTMTMEEAKSYRLELMKERGLSDEKRNSAFEQGSFSLCEH